MPKPRQNTYPPAPLSSADMQAMRAAGDPVSTIMRLAYVRNRMNRDQVRTILFGRQP